MDRIKAIWKNKWFKQILRIVLSVGAIYLILQKVDLPVAVAYMKEANPWWYFLAFLAFFISRWFAASRINTLYRTQQLIIPFWLNLKLFFLSLFYNLFIPLVGGEGYKAIWLKRRYGTRYRSLVGAAFLDRLSGLGLLAVLTLVFLTLSTLDLGFDKRWGLALIPFVLIGHYLFMRWFFPSYLGAWRNISLHSFVIQALQVVTSYFILLAVGQTDQVNDYLFIFLLSSFAFVLPVIGAREGVFVYGADQMGLDSDLSFAIGVLFYIITAINSLMGGTYLLFPSLMEDPDADGPTDSPAASSDL